MITEIVVRFAQEGFHHWPDAPPGRAYLAQRHRHLFHVEVSIEVQHHKREIEFHDFLAFCRAHFSGGEAGSQSCEQMAQTLLVAIQNAYGLRQITVSVFEDGEVGARVKG